MIRDIRPTDNPEVVVAYGQLYDLEKVLDTTENLLKVIVMTLRQAYPAMEPEIACCSADDWEPFTEPEYMRMRTGFMLTQSMEEGYDAGPFDYVIRAGSYKIRIGLLGADSVLRRPDGTLIAMDCRCATTYDPAPKIVINSRWHPAGFMEKDDATFMKAIIGRFLNQGIELEGPQPPDGSSASILFLRFQHAVFGKGEGNLRISCVDTE